MAVCLLPKQETRVRFSYPAQVKILMGSTCPVVKRSFYYRGSHHPLNMKYLSSLKTKNLSGKICLLRADFNIENAELSEKNIHPRIAAVLPAINFLTKKGAKVVILSHRGRPDTTSFKFQTSDFTLKPFAKILSKLLKEPVGFVEFSKINNLTNLTKFNFVRWLLHGYSKITLFKSSKFTSFNHLAIFFLYCIGPSKNSKRNSLWVTDGKLFLPI